MALAPDAGEPEGKYINPAQDFSAAGKEACSSGISEAPTQSAGHYLLADEPANVVGEKDPDVHPKRRLSPFLLPKKRLDGSC